MAIYRPMRLETELGLQAHPPLLYSPTSNASPKGYPMSFAPKLQTASLDNDSVLCIGLDPDPRKLPEGIRGTPDPVFTFLREIIAATSDLACAYKPNFAFFGALGTEGMDVLSRVIRTIPDRLPVLLDFKAGDIGNTAERYASMAYEVLGADAATVNPYMGYDAVAPFLAHAEKCAFLLCLTSNEGSRDFQRQLVDGDPLYKVVARKARVWSNEGDCGLVVGATHPTELSEIRDLVPDLPLLIPGVGAQGGDTADLIERAKDPAGGGVLVNASRGILFASSDVDYAAASRASAERLRAELSPSGSMPEIPSSP